MLFGLLNPKHNKIQFRASKIALKNYPHPTVAYKKIPEWYRKLKPSIKNQPINQSTAKRCIPFLEAVSQGYVIPAWCDIHVCVYHPVELFDEDGKLLNSIYYPSSEVDLIGTPVVQEDGKTELVHSVKRSNKKSVTFNFAHQNVDFPDGRPTPSLETHPWEQVGDMCDIARFELGKKVGKLISPWNIRTPKGWSCYFKNPANSFSNDLTLFEGVVDTDEYHAPVNFPFFWAGSEVGDFIIPKGSPLVQVIPFKRQTIGYSVEEETFDFESYTIRLLDTYVFDKYKRLFWHKRDKYNK